MSTTGQFSTKNPTIKRILKEASELSTSPSTDYTAHPLETNLFEWHFTIRGPPSPSPFANGIYHGRIVLPPSYPLRPPSFRFLTPSGRFEPNREICLSISGFHEESWQPAWGIRTALVAIRSFMDSEAGGQVGGMSASEGVRVRLAGESRAWRCSSGCGGKSCEEIMREQEDLVRENMGEGEDGDDDPGGKKKKKREEEEKVPDELRLGYKDELGANKTETVAGEDAATVVEGAVQGTVLPVAQPAADDAAVSIPVRPFRETAPVARPGGQQPATGPQAPPPQRQIAVGQDNAGIPSWIDKAIIGVALALAFMVFRLLFL